MAIACLTACIGACSPLPCDVAFVWRASLPVPTPLASARALTVTLCRNGECETGDLRSLPTETRDRDGTVGVFPFEASAQYASIWLHSRGPDVFQLEVMWPYIAPEDGDRYSIEVLDARGARIVGLDEIAVDYVDDDRDGFVGDECHAIQLGEPLIPRL